MCNVQDREKGSGREREMENGIVNGRTEMYRGAQAQQRKKWYKEKRKHRMLKDWR